MTIILNMLNPLRMYSDDGAIGLTMSLLIWVLALIILWLIIIFSEPLWKPLLFNVKYSQRQTHSVEVVSKKFYTTTTTTYIHSNNVMIPMMITNYHYDLFFKGSNFQQELDHEGLYNSVKEGDKGELSYVVEIWKFKWESRDKFRARQRIDFQWKAIN